MPSPKTKSISREPVKHRLVRDAIAAAIRSGEFAPGTRLPGEPELAQRFGVSYMTARRAVTEMVEVDLLERRPHAGTYVRLHSLQHLGTVTVNLIYPPAQSYMVEQFLAHGVAKLQTRGWRHHLIQLQPERERPVLRALESGEPCLILMPAMGLEAPINRALQRSQGHAVLIGNRLQAGEVPAVMADDARAISLLMEHLQGAGHRNIGVVSNHPNHTVDHIQIRAWEEHCARDTTPEQMKRRFLFVDTPGGANLDELTFDAVRTYLESPSCDITAFICLNDRMALATLAACRAVNRPVPEKMSVVTSGNNPSLRFFYPPVTCVDVHIERHIDIALELLDEALQNQTSKESLRLVEPTLVKRESVAPPIR